MIIAISVILLIALCVPPLLHADLYKTLGARGLLTAALLALAAAVLAHMLVIHFIYFFPILPFYYGAAIVAPVGAGFAAFYFYLKKFRSGPAPEENTGRRDWLPRLLVTALVVMLMGYAGFISLFILIFGGTKAFYLYGAFFCWLLLLYIFLLFIWSRSLLKKLRKALLSVFLICACAMGGYYLWEMEQDKIPVLYDRYIDLDSYRPFRPSSKLARLDRPASFKIAANLPRLDGATALYPIMAAFVEAVYPPGDYSQPQSVLNLSGTSAAYQALIDGQTDMILAAAPSPAQEQAAAAAGRPLKLTPIGKEAFVFFVNSHNPVTNLTVEQIQDIYGGAIGNWRSVGGKNEVIRAFQRNEGSGSQSALERFMQGKPLTRPPTAERPGSMGGMVTMTADYRNHANALGFSFRYFTAQMFASGQIRLLSVNGVAPSIENIKSGSYPLTGEFYAVTAGSQNPHVQPFIDWMLSAEGQALIEQTGYAGMK